MAAESAKLNTAHHAAAVSLEFTSTVHCPSNTPGNPVQAYCQAAIEYCALSWPGSTGPLTQIWDRRIYSNGDPPSTWHPVALTCYTTLIPGHPVLSLAQIRDAFHHTPFAAPGLTLQPQGNLTLVTLPAYYHVHWPTRGYQPGETDTINPAAMLGNTVRIRPTLVSYTYTFGDGTTTGPTPSPGGTYPTGDITHTYPTPGAYQVAVTIIYSADFSINGSPWIPIHDTVPITGPPQTLTVTTAINRLYNN